MKRFRQWALILSIVIFGTALLASCSGLKLSSKDCADIELTAVETVINSLEAQGKIRPDQAVARKKEMRKTWNSYIQGQLTCEELRKKARYHTDGAFPQK